MGIILWIVFGSLAGWIASMIVGTNNEQGLVLNIIVGIAGAVLGGWLMSLIGESGVTSFNLYSFFVAIAGACILLTLLRVVRR